MRVPLLTIAQLVGNISRAPCGARSIAWKPALLFLAAAIPAAIAGSYCFVAMPKALVTRAIGVAIVLFVVLKWRGLFTFEMTLPRLGAAGSVVGFLSGLVGSAGPLGAAAFLRSTWRRSRTSRRRQPPPWACTQRRWRSRVLVAGVALVLALQMIIAG